MLRNALTMPGRHKSDYSGEVRDVSSSDWDGSIGDSTARRRILWRTRCDESQIESRRNVDNAHRLRRRTIRGYRARKGGMLEMSASEGEASVVSMGCA